MLCKGSYKIPNYKHQITNKSQIPIINDQNFMFEISNFGHCDLFDICDLLFEIFPIDIKLKVKVRPLCNH